MSAVVQHPSQELRAQQLCLQTRNKIWKEFFDAPTGILKCGSCHEAIGINEIICGLFTAPFTLGTSSWLVVQKTVLEIRGIISNPLWENFEMNDCEIPHTKMHCFK